MIPMVDDHWNRCHRDLNGCHLDKLVLKAIDHLLLLFDYLRLQGHLWQYRVADHDDYRVDVVNNNEFAGQEDVWS